MKITAIRAYQIDLPLKEGRYAWSNGNAIETFDSTLVEIETDEGVKGYGESCPLGSTYLPAYAKGVRAGIAEIAPGLIGEDPRNVQSIARKMDALLRGHPYVKSAIDVGCWDVVGRCSGLPLAILLGGLEQSDVGLYRAISQESPAAMKAKVRQYRAEGYRKFQLKVGGDADTDIERIRACREALQPGDVLIADANTGWTAHEAIRILNAVKDLDVYIEQPCRTYEECLSVRQRTSLPFILDETIENINVLMRAIGDRAMDAINLKIARVGGLTRAKEIRDLCIHAGIPMTIEDTWGGDVVTAAIAHLAASTPEEFLFSATDFNSYVTRAIAEGAPKRRKGRMAPSHRPGLGIVPLAACLKKPVFEIGSKIGKSKKSRP